MKRQKRRRNTETVKPGMTVETTRGDLGEHDISTPVVEQVITNDAGQVAGIVVEKGAIFKKEIVVPASRITEVEPRGASGKVVIATTEDEVEGLAPTGTESLTLADKRRNLDPTDLLSTVEEELPSAEGLRRKEGRNATGEATPPDARQPNALLRMLGPGFLAGMAGNDASAVTSYSVNGATNGYGQLWLMLLATPMFQSVQFTCGKIGRVTQKGLGTILRDHYGQQVAVPAALILIIANVGLIAGDLVAIGSGIQLITGIYWLWFVIPTAAILWYVTVFQNFDTIKKIFTGMSLAFIAYLITGVMSHPNWGAVLKDTFVPNIGLGFASISSAVALLGATVSPYTMYWQAQGEKEEQRAGSTHRQIKSASYDIASGVISGNLVAYFIIVATSATLFAHHQQIKTAADAAQALAPLVGPYAKYLFAIGLIGAGLVAIPVLLASTSYAVSGTFGWTASLWHKPWQSEGFYLTLSVALVVSVVIALLRFDPIQIMFWVNVLQGLLAPVLVVLVILVANNNMIMHKFKNTLITNIMLGVTALVMITATVLFFIGLATGAGG